MQAINRKNMRTNKFLSMLGKSIRHVRQLQNVPYRAFPLSAFLCFVLLLAGSFGCAPPQQNSPDSASNDLPELTEEVIRERINDAYVREVPAESGTAETIGWSFDEDEPKEIAVVEKQTNGTHATIDLNIKTRSAPNRSYPRQLEGQIRTEWELKTGWALRRWEIVRTENISMKYKNIPKPPEQNSNR